MHPETKKLHKSHALSRWQKNLKLQLSPGLVASYDIQSENGVGLFWDTHMLTYLLTCPWPRSAGAEDADGVVEKGPWAGGTERYEITGPKCSGDPNLI